MPADKSKGARAAATPVSSRASRCSARIADRKEAGLFLTPVATPTKKQRRKRKAVDHDLDTPYLEPEFGLGLVTPTKKKICTGKTAYPTPDPSPASTLIPLAVDAPVTPTPTRKRRNRRNNTIDKTQAAPYPSPAPSPTTKPSPYSFDALLSAAELVLCPELDITLMSARTHTYPHGRNFPFARSSQAAPPEFASEYTRVLFAPPEVERNFRDWEEGEVGEVEMGDVEERQGDDTSSLARQLEKYSHSVTSKTNITWAGQSFGGYFESDGLLRGEHETVTVSCDGQSCPVRVPGPSVALVFLTDASYEPSDSFMTFATSHTTLMHNTAAVDGLTLQTSNGLDGELREKFKGSGTSRQRKNGAGSKFGSGSVSLVVGAALVTLLFAIFA